MHIKHMHEMIEKLTDCTKSAIENDQVSVGQYPISDVVDMIKDLNEASYYASIVKAMEEAKKEDEEEEKHMLRMLKDEHKEEYKRMREEYGEDEGKRRFYDNYRYKTTGRFAPKGKGSYDPRRGYIEPPYYHMTPDKIREHDPEWYRDMDRIQGKLYYTPTMTMTDGRNDGSIHTDGDVRGYSEGYSDGMRDGKKSGESRYDRARRGYEEKKELHKGNTPEDNSENMKGLEELLNVVGGDVKELTPKMSPSEKAMTAQKFDVWSKMLKQ